MDICEYVDLQDMISQAKLVEGNCIAENDNNFDTGLTRRIIQHPNRFYLKGIHETVEHRSNSNPEVRFHSEDHTLSVKEDNSILQSVFPAIPKIQNSVSKLENRAKE